MLSKDANALTSKEKEENREKKRANPFSKLLVVMGIGLAGILSYSIQASSLKQFVQMAGVGTITAGASTLVGALLGFLFGIPRTLQQDRPPGASPAGSKPTSPAAAPSGSNAPVTSQSGYQANTNLEQISDWLTKILVGVGLTQLGPIITKLQQIAAGTAVGMGIPDGNPAFPMGEILYFLVCGFLFSYLWTRLFLPGMFREADNSGLERDIGKIRTTAETAQALALGTGKQTEAEAEERERALPADAVEPGAVAGDPWKGKFGGQNISNNRKLEATVTKMPSASDLFSIRLRVSSTDQQRYPLQGAVRFFLHPTFNVAKPTIPVGPDGMAELTLTAWGAFTVGAIADNGATKLELDLAQLGDAPLEFRNR